MKDPYQIVIRRYVTEKASVLESLQNRTSNKSLARFKSPKHIFIVDPSANKKEIADAVEEIYSGQSVKVRSVNTIWVKGKEKRRRTGRPGRTKAFKKAIVTLSPGDTIVNQT